MLYDAPHTGVSENTLERMWVALNKWHIPYTVYMAQPVEYWDDMFKCEDLHGWFMWNHRPEAEEALKAKAGKR